MSKLEKNLHRISHSREATYELESLIFAWEETHGEPPDETQLEILSEGILQKHSWWYNPVRGAIWLAIALVLAYGLVTRFIQCAVDVSNATSLY